MDENLVILDNGNQGVDMPFNADVRGSSGAETVRVPAGRDVSFTANNEDAVELPGALADYEATQQGNILVLEDADAGTRARIGINADTTIAFSDGAATAAFDTSLPGITLGGEPVGDGFDPANVQLSAGSDTGTGDDSGSGDGGDGNSVFLDGGDQTVRLPFDADVTGTAGAETVQVDNGADVSFTGGEGDRVEFAGNAADFKLDSSGNGLTVAKGDTEADISVNGGVEVAFADGSAEADIGTDDEGRATVTLGGQGVGPDFDPTQLKLDAKGAAKFDGKDSDDTTDDGGLPPLPADGGPEPVSQGTEASENIDGNQDGATLSGGGGEDRIILQQEVTTVTVDDFAEGDQLFFDGTTLGDVSVDNGNFSDGKVDIAAGEVSVTVTNLSADADSGIVDGSSFESTLGGNALGFPGEAGSGDESGDSEDSGDDEPAEDQTITGTDGDDDLEGGAGDDVLEGLAGSDELEGEEGDDTLLGGSGDDELDGGSGDDTLTGGEDADTFSFDLGTDDSAEDDDDDAADDDEDGEDQDDNEDEDEEEDEDDDDGDRGAGGREVVRAQNEGDTVDGGNGPDIVLGLGGDETLRGGNGPDVLAGGEGNDTLTGGNGPTSFNVSGGDDTVTDFFAPTDTLIFRVGDDDTTAPSDGDTTDGGSTDDGSTDDGSTDDDSTDDGESDDDDDDDGDDDDDDEEGDDDTVLPEGVTAEDTDAGLVLDYAGGLVTLEGVELADLGNGNLQVTDDPLLDEDGEPEDDVGDDDSADDDDDDGDDSADDDTDDTADGDDDTDTSDGDDTADDEDDGTDDSSGDGDDDDTEEDDDGDDDDGDDADDDTGAAGHGSDTVTDFELGTDTIEFEDAPDDFALDDIEVAEIAGEEDASSGVELSHDTGEVEVLGGDVTTDTLLEDYVTLA